MPLQDPDDIYSDPQTIGDDDADDILAEDDLPAEQKREISQTPFLTENRNDDRGDIPELGDDSDEDSEIESPDEVDGTER
jgi:hypothetical protein